MLFLTHTGGCEVINTKAVTYLHAPRVSSAVRCLHRACKTDNLYHNIPLLSCQLSTLGLVFVLLNPTVTLLPAEHTFYTDLLYIVIILPDPVGSNAIKFHF